jgi:hypothetical protein
MAYVACHDGQVIAEALRAHHINRVLTVRCTPKHSTVALSPSREMTRDGMAMHIIRSPLRCATVAGCPHAASSPTTRA